MQLCRGSYPQAAVLIAAPVRNRCARESGLSIEQVCLNWYLLKCRLGGVMLGDVGRVTADDGQDVKMFWGCVLEEEDVEWK